MQLICTLILPLIYPDIYIYIRGDLRCIRKLTWIDPSDDICYEFTIGVLEWMMNLHQHAKSETCVIAVAVADTLKLPNLEGCIKRNVRNLTVSMRNIRAHAS